MRAVEYEAANPFAMLDNADPIFVFMPRMSVISPFYSRLWRLNASAELFKVRDERFGVLKAIHY